MGHAKAERCGRVRTLPHLRGHASRMPGDAQALPEAQLLSTGRLWAEACFWAIEMFNKSLTTAKPGKRSPHEHFHGVVPKLWML